MPGEETQGEHKPRREACSTSSLPQSSKGVNPADTSLLASASSTNHEMTHSYCLSPAPPTSVLCYSSPGKLTSSHPPSPIPPHTPPPHPSPRGSSWLCSATAERSMAGIHPSKGTQQKPMHGDRASSEAQQPGSGEGSRLRSIR